jgi:hypothetical protein
MERKKRVGASGVESPAQRRQIDIEERIAVEEKPD